MIVLGIESSCDETAAAVLENGRKILANVVASQNEIHGKYGGVVPELAARSHLESIIPVINTALSNAGIALEDLDGIAATQGPGLVGSLLVGLSVAKAIAYVKNIPIVGVNHVEGHMAAVFLEHQDLTHPFIALVVSGGHTSLYEAKAFGEDLLLGQTLDDAAGEAFDKVAKCLRLGYPGGVLIDKLSEGGAKDAFHFPRAWMGNESLDFSFSGLKTAVITATKKIQRDLTDIEVRDVAASFQEAVVDVLVGKAFLAARKKGLKKIVVSGGVASNRRLRERLREEAKEAEIALFMPSPSLCTDNAAMIAVAGTYALSKERKRHASLAMNAFSRLSNG